MADTWIDLPAVSSTTPIGTVIAIQGTTPWIVAGTVTVNQGTSPWVTSRTWNLNSTTDSVSAVQSGTWNIGTVTTITNPVTVNQGTSPWVTSRTWNLSSGTDSVTVVQGTSPWVISGSTTVTGTVTANQGTSPWVISGTVAATQSGTWTTGRTWTLSSGTDSIAAVQSGTWNIGTVTTITNPVAVTQSTSPWVVSGSVTTSPNVNVHDGTGVSISSTGSSLNVDVTNTVPVSQSGAWTVSATQGTSPWVISGTVTANAGTNLNTSALALDTSVNGILLSQGSTTSGEKGPLIQGAVTTSDPTYVTGQTNPFSLTTSGRLRTDSTATVTGSVTVVGNVASGAADSGNPVKTGAVYNSTLPSFTSGNRTDLQSNKFGELAVRSRNKFINLTGVTTTVVKTGPGVLHGIYFNNGTTSTVLTIYDNTAASGTIIMKPQPGGTGVFGTGVMNIGAEFSTGLTVAITNAAATDITIFYQ